MKYNPYSFSKISTFYFCPYKFKLNYIDKIKVKTNQQHFEKGRYIHYLIENYFNEKEDNYKIDENKKKEYKLIFNKIIPYLENIKNNFKNIEPEKEFGLKIQNNKLILTNYYDKNAIIRGAIDLVAFKNNKLYLFDWKTGKVPEKPNVLQVLIYAIWGFLYCDIDEIVTKFIYVEHNKEKEYKFHKKYLNKMILALIKHIKKIEIEQTFHKNITNLCNWCDYYLQGYCDISSKPNDFMKFNPF